MARVHNERNLPKRGSCLPLIQGIEAVQMLRNGQILGAIRNNLLTPQGDLASVIILIERYFFREVSFPFQTSPFKCVFRGKPPLIPIEKHPGRVERWRDKLEGNSLSVSGVSAFVPG